MRGKLLGPTLALAAFMLSAITGLPSPAKAETEVDLALVLAVDVSYSMDPDEQRLQREGFIEAFRSGVVQEAIRSGMLGRIAVVYMEWAGAAHQQVVVPWTVVDGREAAAAFADRLAGTPTGRAFWTSVSGAIEAGARLMGMSGVTAERRVIDVSGDGPNNQGRVVTAARDEAVAAGITINGLPILMKRGTSAWDIPDLDLYYRDCVIGGPRAFMVPVREREEFAKAIRTKLVMEIAGLAPPEPLIRQAQSEARANCLVGEMQRRRSSDN